MRAVKSVLLAARALKKNYPDKDESQLVLRAIIDVNLAKYNHYDYGMRAVKSVLLAAGALKKNYPDKDESQLVLRAIIDVTLAKYNHYDYGMCAVKSVLLAAGALKKNYLDKDESQLVLRAIIDDVPLFIGIYSDLFPGVEVPQPDRAEMMRCINKEVEKRNLQPTEWYLEKIVQIYEMMLVRHGFMVVGPPMGGKTQAYQSLAESLRALQLVKPPARHKDKKLIPEQFELIQELIEWLIPPIFEFQLLKCHHFSYSFSRLFTCLLEGESQFST
ncbi:Uncharacterized protein OBRU01_07490, partial [Operophtera brumata]